MIILHNKQDILGIKNSCKIVAYVLSKIGDRQKRNNTIVCKATLIKYQYKNN